MISPMLNGNKVFGGIDPDTSLTYGFSPETGEVDKTKNMKEKDMYGAICQALGLNYPGRAYYKSMIRKA
ncbi:MAG: hypothetical protein H7318_06580 [Oligoflexus sp.]|nr:hypothetical protein [Oligoflexus sp.]